MKDRTFWKHSDGVRKRVLSAAYCVMILWCLTGCFVVRGGHGETEEPVLTGQVAEPAPTESEAVEEIPAPDDSETTSAEPEEPTETGGLSSVADIDLHAVDDIGRDYVFVYRQEAFSARYTEDNWKVIDSYKIDDTEDIVMICQALLDVHPIHGRDMESIRTAEDMAFEWVQHNIAYAFLPDDSPWKQNVKDVDLNPSDQGKTFQEMYEDRTGEKFHLEDFLPRTD